VRRALLPDALSAAQQHPGLAEDDGRGRLREAYVLSAQTSSMPEICGRICPQDRLCEGSCVIEQSGHGTVTIGAVERYINDKAWEMGGRTGRVGRTKGRSVGVSARAAGARGGAPRERGYAVTVYDRTTGWRADDYGIPGFKLEKDVVARRVRLAGGGSSFVSISRSGGREPDRLRARHDAC
jgi:glutamate synthase (NADPH/NADH) small chain